MRCKWCSNPESLSSEPQLLFRFTSCKKCGDCTQVCKANAITFDPEKGPLFDRDKCTVCGKCARECIYEAIKITGEAMDVDKVWKAIRKDLLYFEESGGGVTCSGGEILMQPDFVAEIFKRCRENGVHTCADTAGGGTEDAMAKILEYADLVYFDLKCLDDVRLKELTGMNSKSVVNNFKKVCESGKPIVVRVPLVPEQNNDADCIKEIATFVKSNAPNTTVHIMPYHRYGENKYESIGMTYPLTGLRENTEEELELARKIFEAEGLTVEVK